MNKSEYRKKGYSIRNLYDKKYIINASEIIFNKIFELEEFKKAENIFAYMNFRNEIVTDLFIDKIKKLNKKFFIPTVISKEEMIFSEYNINNINVSNYGIREIKKNSINEFLSNDKTIIIIPALIFDKNLYRIGYGGGYYDRYLQNNKYLISIGIGLEEQVIDNFPKESYDIKLDYIITEKNIYI